MRKGTSMVELLVTMALGALVLGVGLRVMFSSRTAELRTWARADALEQAALAHGWIKRDLASFLWKPDRQVPLIEGATGGRGPVAITIPVAQASGEGEVAYRFDPATGVLTREATGAPLRKFELGERAEVGFVFVDPSFAFREGAELGQYGNRVVCWLTAHAGGERDRQSVTLVAATPVRTKAARDTFGFWADAPSAGLP